MDRIEKLFAKISKKDRNELLQLLQAISRNEATLKIVKIKNTDFFRVRSGRYRIIFHKDKAENVIDSIRLRDDNTYKHL